VPYFVPTKFTAQRPMVEHKIGPASGFGLEFNAKLNLHKNVGIILLDAGMLFGGTKIPNRLDRSLMPTPACKATSFYSVRNFRITTARSTYSPMVYLAPTTRRSSGISAAIITQL
jgi:hypothetical protein